MRSEICKKCADKSCYGYDRRISECEDFQPMTNYDLLISKTPEEMAVWFCQCMLDCCGCPAFSKCMKYGGEANERSKTAPGLVDWLKSPVEEEESK